ncbi:Osmosensitive K channel His kinase sensor, partial [human gut metagenome]
QLALNNFFKTENILQLRELALKEVAFRVEKKVENEIVTGEKGIRHEKFLACISSNERTPRHIIRKAARLASRYNTVFFALYVQTPTESTERIPLATQRHLLNHFKLVTELGGALDSTIGELLVDGWKADKSPEIQPLIASERKKRLGKMFDSLNTLGQDIAIEQVEMLTKIPEYQKKPSAQILNAAHDNGATEEQKAHADKIMDDDSEWE